MSAPPIRNVGDWKDLVASQEAELEKLRAEVEYLDDLVQDRPDRSVSLDPATLEAAARLIDQLGRQYATTHQDARTDAYETGGDWSLGYLAALGNAIDLLRALAGESVG